MWMQGLRVGSSRRPAFKKAAAAHACKPPRMHAYACMRLAACPSCPSLIPAAPTVPGWLGLHNRPAQHPPAAPPGWPPAPQTHR